MREIAGPKADSPVIVLLHGWTATMDLNWFTSFQPLSRRYRVIALDQRGHARGIRGAEQFTLEDCADDAAALAEALGVQRFIPVGYSMGGAVAQLVAHRHADKVEGLVLCSTAPHFASSRGERLSFVGLTGLAAIARATPPKARAWVTEQVYLQRKADKWDPWAIDQVSNHDWRMVLEAGSEIGTFDSRPWLPDVTVPSAVVATMHDRIVPPRRQVKLFELLPNVEAYRIDGDHDACVNLATTWVPLLIRAIESVVERARRGTA